MLTFLLGVATTALGQFFATTVIVPMLHTTTKKLTETVKPAEEAPTMTAPIEQQSWKKSSKGCYTATFN